MNGSRHAHRRLRWGAPLVLVSSMALAACGGGSPSSSAKTSHPSGPTYEVSTAKVGNLGTILVDGKGYTLYLFLPDNASGRSTCFGLCAAQWPPLTLPSDVSSPVAGPGVKSTLLGTTTRPGGARQVTYAGWPLYLWPNDTQPGQATGQGINNLGGLWYVVSPSGEAVR